MNNITVAGSGVLGSQIAFQTALHGYDVTLYDVSEEALGKAAKGLETLAAIYQRDAGATAEATAAALARIRLGSDVGAALEDADLLIESVPESVEIKTAFYRQAAALAPQRTIFATNSSTLLPSQFAEATGRPERFLALHFANEIWLRNITELMGHAGTSAQVFDQVAAFAQSIGMVVLPLHKEQPGYISNSLLVPWVTAALRLWADDVADFQTIDKTWMAAVRTPFAPFVFTDLAGLNTAYNITMAIAEQTGDALLRKAGQRMKTEYLDKGKLGLSSGEGFYSYPNPAFMADSFYK